MTPRRKALLLALAAGGLVACALAGLLLLYGHNLERRRWNLIFSSPWPSFNTEPSRFLVEALPGRKPGTALDLGMGQGRNAVYLARQGWQVTGVDVSDVGIAQAREQARKAGVSIHTVLQDADSFDFGRSRWDLVAVIYFPPRAYIARIRESLRPGGLVVVEGFHRDAARRRRIGPGVVFDSGELPRLFEGFRVLRYEEVTDVADWGKQQTRLVRLLAQKPI
jgi:SAM-dependent methyltransferase